MEDLKKKFSTGQELKISFKTLVDAELNLYW